MITFNNPQDFEATTPNDADNDNVFEIIVSAEMDDDANNKLSTLTPIISLTIINDNDPPYFPSEETQRISIQLRCSTKMRLSSSLALLCGVGDPDVLDTGADEITVTLQMSEQMAQFKSR